MNLFYLERQDQAIREVLQANSQIDTLLLELHSIPETESLHNDLLKLTKDVSEAIKRREERIKGLCTRLNDLALLLADVNSCSATLRHRKVSIPRPSGAEEELQHQTDRP